MISRTVAQRVSFATSPEGPLIAAPPCFKTLDRNSLDDIARDRAPPSIRAILGVLAYTGARVGAVAKLRLSDYRNLGDGRVLRFREKVGKDREIPVRHDLAAWLDEYMNAAGIAENWKGAPLFRAADGKRKVLTPAPYCPHLMRQMMKRRLEDAGLPELFSPHSFRVTVVTDLLNQNVPLEDVQYLAGHSSPTITRVYESRRPTTLSASPENGAGGAEYEQMELHQGGYRRDHGRYRCRRAGQLNRGENSDDVSPPVR